MLRSRLLRRQIRVSAGRMRLFRVLSSAKQQRDAPQTGQPDQRIDHAADAGGLTAEDPRDQIEFCESDEAPVDRTDDRKDER